MATLNVNRARNTLTDPSFYMTAGLVVGGLVLSSLMTEFMRANVMDIGVRGGDALYSLVASGVSLVVLPSNLAEPVALGCGASAVAVAGRELGIVDI